MALVSSVSIAHAIMIDITNPALTHFASFVNDPPAGALSHISDDPATNFTYGSYDFGWHNSPSGTMPEYAGILLGSASAVTTLRLQVHVNPFKDFILQGSNDTTTGLNGVWDNLLTSTVTNRTEGTWQEWAFANPNSYSAYRIKAENDYLGGWAMYRWELLADNTINPNPVPEPSTILLFGSGLLGIITLITWRNRLGRNEN